MGQEFEDGSQIVHIDENRSLISQETGSGESTHSTAMTTQSRVMPTIVTSETTSNDKPLKQ